MVTDETKRLPNVTNELSKSLIREKENEIADIYSQLTMQKRFFKTDLNSTVKLYHQESLIATEENMKVKESELLKLIDHFERYAVFDRDVLVRNLEEERKKREEQSTQLSSEIALRKKVEEELKTAKEKLATMENKLHTSNTDLDVLQKKLSVGERDFEKYVFTDRNILLQKLDEVTKKCDGQNSQLKNQIALRKQVEDELKKEKINVHTSKNDLLVLQRQLSDGEREKEENASQMKAAQLKILDLCQKLMKTQHELKDSMTQYEVTKKHLQEEKDFNEILTKEFQLISADAYQPLTDCLLYTSPSPRDS